MIAVPILVKTELHAPTELIPTAARVWLVMRVTIARQTLTSAALILVKTEPRVVRLQMVQLLQ